MSNTVAKLEEIGFYTLSDERAETASEHSQMKRCEMIIIENCNFKCDYCRGLDDRVFGDRKRKQLTLEEIKQNIDYWCEGEPLENIRFSGGEPTLHKGLVEAVAYANQKGIKRIAISTNGSNRPKVYQKLIAAGCNDFSISLDSDNAETGDMMAGNIVGVWVRLTENIKRIAAQVYTTVGVVLTPDNIKSFIATVKFASSLGVADIRVIPSAQWNGALTELKDIPESILNKHPILKYRVNNFIAGIPVRGINNDKTNKCPLVLDDSIIAGDEHYPCVIYMREQGDPIGKVHAGMRQDRKAWYDRTNTHSDPICAKNCLDVCVSYNSKVMENKLYNDKEVI